MPQDYDKAFSFFEAAAGLEHTEAQFKVGWCYLYGEGVKKNVSEARKWLTMASDDGHEDALRCLLEISGEDP